MCGVNDSLQRQYAEFSKKCSEPIATLPPFRPIEGHKWFYQISSRFYINLFRKFPVFTSLHLRSPVHGWKRNYVPKKFHGIAEWIPLFPGRKCSFRGHCEVHRRAHTGARNRPEWFYKTAKNTQENDLSVPQK